MAPRPLDRLLWLLTPLFVFCGACRGTLVSFAATCQRDRGCPKAALVSPCSDGQASLSREELLARAGSLVGQRVSVQGPLNQEPQLCTARFCESGCCNSCIGGLMLGTVAEMGDARAHAVLTLTGTDVRCHGDETLMCCPFDATGQQVVAQGTLRGDSAGRGYYSLEDTSLCVLPSP